MADDPKASGGKPVPEEQDERLYGDTVFDPDIEDKVSPEMKKWLADLRKKTP